MDIYTGNFDEFSGIHTFEPWGSLMIFEDGTRNVSRSEEAYVQAVLDDKFKFVQKPVNALTLDKCDYYFDGELQEKNGYVLNICERANALEKAVKIHMDYHVKVEYIPKQLEIGRASCRERV